MALTIERKRQKILEKYPRWNALYTMEDRQISAIYSNMSERGQFNPGYQKKISRPINKEENRQLNLADWAVQLEEMKGEI